MTTDDLMKSGQVESVASNERHQQLRMGYGLSEWGGEAHQCTANVRGITLGMRGTTQRRSNSAGVLDPLR